MRPLLFLTLALCAAEGGPDEGPGPEAERRPWPRPADREPADDWSERTGIPSPFPCRAAMVWCDSHKTDRLNPDGTDRGTWVPADGWFGPDDPRAASADAPSGLPDESPYIDALLAAFVERSEAEALLASLTSHKIDAWIVEQATENPEHGGTEPVYAVIAKVQVPDRFCGQDGVAVATVDPAPLREAADQLAQTAGEFAAVVDEVMKADDADDSH